MSSVDRKSLGAFTASNVQVNFLTSKMRIRTIFLITVILFFAACGRRTPPLPPQAVRPVPPSGIKLTLTPSGVKICWNIPRQTVNNNPLPGLKGFRIVRLSRKNKKGPLSRKIFFLPLDQKAWVRGTSCFEDHHLHTGCRYEYLIQAVRGWRCVSDPVQTRVFAWHTPPRAPQSLKAQGGDGKVCLIWAPVKYFVDSRPVSRGLYYRIYRYQRDRVVLVARKVTENTFCDQGLANEKVYCYRVEPVFFYQGTMIPGPKSPRACARTRDLTPPRPPEGLVAVPEKRGVLLRWFRNGELDLAGYRVYRKRPGEPPKLLTPRLLKQPKFFDTSLPGPGLYYYWVTAVDSSPRANESAPSEMVEVKYGIY